MNKNRYIVFPALLFSLCVLVAVPAFLFAVAKVGNTQAGMEVHKKQCLRCHGEQGKGDGPGSNVLKTKPADWTDAARMSTLSDAELFQVIKEGGAAVGKSKLMPAFGAKLKDQDIANAIALIRSLQKGKK